MHLGVAHDAAARLGAAGLELRLDEHQRPPGASAGTRAGERRGQRRTDADEGHVARHETRPERQLLAGKPSRVHALDHRHARVGAQPLVQLGPPDVERAHACRAVLQETVGEAAGRGSDVEALLVADIDGQDLDRVCELLAAARDETRALDELELGGIVDLSARLREASHPAGQDERLRLRARLGQAALHEQHVQPLLHRSKS